MATIDGTQKKLTVSGEAIESAVNSKHEHSNKTVLDKLSDNNGTLQYNGADITGGGSGTGGADEQTIIDAVNNYLTENPVQAMSDEEIAESVNNGIASESIDVMAGVKDGSVTKNKLDTDLFMKKYRIKSISAWSAFGLKSSKNISVVPGDKVSVSFKIKSLVDITDEIIMQFLTINDSYKIEISRLSPMKANGWYDYTIDKEFTEKRTLTGVRGYIYSSNSKEINIELYDIKILVNDIEVTDIDYTITVSDTSDSAIAKVEIDKNNGFADSEFVLNNLLDTKNYIDSKTDGIIEEVNNKGIYPFDKSVVPPSVFLNGVILNLELYNIPMNVLNEGIYIRRMTTWWLDLYYGDGKKFLTEININNSYIHQADNIATYNLNINDCVLKLTIDKSKILGENTQYSKTQTLLSKECIKSVKPSEKTTLSFANSIYVTQGSLRPHAVPIFLDYLYNGQKNKILFENGDDRYYIRSAVGSPNVQDTNIINEKKTLKLKSDTLDVNPLKFNVVSIEEKTKTEPIKVLTIGDSVTAGAITDKQYWAFANEFFTLEDLDRNRTTDVMFLGSRKYRETTVTKGGTTKTVKSFACGVSSWSLKHWMTHEESEFVYFEDGDTEKANPIFSIAKWLERYRTHTDDGVALSIGEEGIGTKITEDNIGKIQCCTPNVIYINSCHNDYGEVLENTKAIMQKIREELPDVKIIVAGPMGITGTWNKDKYINKDWIDSSEITGPNINWGGSYGSVRLQLLDYLTEQEKLNDLLYVMPQMLIQPTVEGLSYEEVDCGVKIMKRPNKINQLASIHPGTITHKIWGYEMYCLLKYIFRSSDTTTNEVTVTLDNTTLSLVKEGTDQLTATPSTPDTEVTFSSSDTSIATVDSTGLITAIATGTCYVYAETETSIRPAVCTVTVTE